MAGYLSGWACGFTAVKAMRELNEAWPGYDYLFLTVTLVATAVVAVIILVLRPSTVVMGCFGASAKLLRTLLAVEPAKGLLSASQLLSRA